MIDNNLNVVKHNKLVNAQWLDDFTVFEQQFISVCIAQISSEDKELKEFSVDIVELYEELREYTPRGQKKRKLYESVISLMDKRIKIPAPFDGGEHIFTWFTQVYIEESTGRIVAVMNQGLAEYLLNLEKYFTMIKLGVYKKFKNTYGLKLFQVMSRLNSVATEKWFTIEELKEIFNLVGKYKRPYNFKTRVIEPAIEDINEHADFTLTYEEEKKGRRVTRIKFIKHEKDTGPIAHDGFKKLV